MIKLILKINSEHIEKSVKSASEYFVEMESNCLMEVDIESYLKDYVAALFIFDSRCFTVIEESQP